MLDARWSDVDYDIKSAFRHLEAAARLWATDGFMPSPGLRSGNDADLDAYRAQMALRHALQSDTSNYRDDGGFWGGSAEC